MPIDPTQGIPIRAPGGAGRAAPAGAPAAPAQGPGSFRELLEQSIAEVNRFQRVSEAATEALAAGRTDDIAGVYAAVAQSEQAFHLMLEVRNKLVEAYQEVQRIRV